MVGKLIKKCFQTYNNIKYNKISISELNYTERKSIFKFLKEVEKQVLQKKNLLKKNYCIVETMLFEESN